MLGNLVAEFAHPIGAEQNRAHREFIIYIVRLDADRGDARGLNGGEKRALRRRFAFSLRMIQRCDSALDLVGVANLSVDEAFDRRFVDTDAATEAWCA